MCTIGSRGCDSGVNAPFRLARGNRQLDSPSTIKGKRLVALEFQCFILGELFYGILETLL